MPKRVDSNQAEIVDALRRWGASVVHLHTVGKGCPDLAVAFRGATYLVEVKDGSKKWNMTDDQKRFHAEWKAPIVILDGVESLIMWITRLGNK